MDIHIKASGDTHVGKVREHNEDAFLISMEKSLFMVADGLGGHAAGEVASRMAVDTVETHILASYESLEKLREDITRAIKEANRVIFEESRRNISRRGMGTTIVVAKIEGEKAIIGHVGDSRAYHVRDGKIVQLTEDHTIVEEYVRMGLLSRKDAQYHPYRHVLSRSVGTAGAVDVDIIELDLHPGDVLLLCTDGLTNMLTDGEILDIIISHLPDTEKITHTLIREANERGGIDNITVITVYLF